MNRSLENSMWKRNKSKEAGFLINNNSKQERKESRRDIYESTVGFLFSQVTSNLEPFWHMETFLLTCLKYIGYGNWFVC